MIKIENLHKYFGKLEVLKGIDYEIQENKLSVLLGRLVQEKVHFSVASIC